MAVAAVAVRRAQLLAEFTTAPVQFSVFMNVDFARIAHIGGPDGAANAAPRPLPLTRRACEQFP
jgi:hypothetical protein